MKFLLNKYYLLWLFALLFTLNGSAQVLDKDGIPVPQNPPRLVNDFAGLMSDINAQNLEDKLVRYNDSTSSQIAIVTVKNLGGYPIEDYAIKLARKWGIGQNEKDNGILILVSKEDRLMRIEVGTGLEANVTDLSTKRIRDEILAPAFKQSNYFRGLDDATDRLFQLMMGTYTYSEKEDSGNDDISKLIMFLIIFFAIIILLTIILGKNSKNGSYTMSGGGWNWSGGGGGWSSGGGSWGGGGGGSSGGFGGFGGGGFSGGGSSGSW